ncbi:hypothetical protein [Cupriavidus sp. UME77]|uniref:hypothetical protein n=1 Tax=Cupriavidus sp. UME77 TaxID=1862321 RepID=UPI001603FB24|nr:hypothetical protein [Cupriavidus sp. UME77]
MLASTADAGKNSLTTGTLTTSDIENKAEYSSSSSTIAGSFDSGQSLLKNGVNTLAATAAGSAQKAIEGDAAGTTKSAIANGTVTITNAEAQKEKTGKTVEEVLASLNRDTDGANQALDKIFDAKKVKEQQEANKLQAQIVQQVMPMVYQRIGTALQGQPEAIKVAVHALVGGLVSQALGGDFGKGVAGVAAGTAAIALLNDKLGSMGLSEDDRNAVLQTVGMLVAGAVGGGGAEGSAAAATAGMADAYNRQLHPGEYDIARRYGKLVADKLGIPVDQAEGRIVAELQRNVDGQTAQASGGVHDYSVRSILGCQMLECNASATDSNYGNRNYNSQYIASNQRGYDLGAAQINTGQTPGQLADSNIKKDPVGATLAGAGMIGLGVVTAGGVPTLAGMATGGTIGGVANASMQAAFNNGSVNPVDVAFGTLTGALTYGTGLLPSLLTNTGGALAASGIKGDNPNGGMLGAAVGTAVGYGFGSVVENYQARSLILGIVHNGKALDLGFLLLFQRARFRHCLAVALAHSGRK